MAIVACVHCSFNLTSQIYLAKPISLMFELLIFQDPSVSPLKGGYHCEGNEVAPGNL